ncbi:hypothetical protein AVEN_100520-1 [Araneus ventricosus]|uniref:Uncharacterized protein n=1 Tax=Araneus ventricosus TaxID=182803 RepID=A0A4Y2H593_ARAVE|nr:hypothetical protein AVEN_100520-1 [Araneus ventricosus]
MPIQLSASDSPCLPIHLSQILLQLIKDCEPVTLFILPQRSIVLCTCLPADSATRHCQLQLMSQDRLPGNIMFYEHRERDKTDYRGILCLMNTEKETRPTTGEYYVL